MIARARCPSGPGRPRPSPRTRLLSAWIAAMVALALVACSKREGGATKPNGQTRIVALSPGVALTLRELGLADRIVGRHAFDLALPRSILVCGDQGGIDYETLIAARPTHVLLQWGRRDLPERLVDLANAHHWRVESVDALSLDDIADATRRMGAAFDGVPGVREATDRALERMRRAWSSRGEGVARAGRVLLLASVRPAAALGPGSWHHDILVRLGATPALASGSPYQSLDDEDLVRLDADAIVAILPRDPFAPDESAQHDGPDPLSALRRLRLKAIEGGRAAVIDDPHAFVPGPHMAAFADELARVLEEIGRRPDGAKSETGRSRPDRPPAGPGS